MTKNPKPDSSSEQRPVSPRSAPDKPQSFQGQPQRLIDRVVNLLDPAGNILLGTSLEEATASVKRGDVEAVRRIGGQYALCEQSGKTIRMARSIGRPMRYFLAKRAEGPALIIAERIDEIAQQLESEVSAISSTILHSNGTRTPPA